MAEWKILYAVALIVLLFAMAGCAPRPESSVAFICTETLDMRKEHARALVEASDAHPDAGGGGALAPALITGQTLLSEMKEACRE